MADKEARARGVQAMMSMGKVWWPKFAPWKTDVQGQLLRFPAGKYDDAVDALGLFGRGLEFVTPMQVKLKKIAYSLAGIV
jgi:phage terminase large subunit-like protein